MVIRVQTRDNEPVEKALRRLRKLCNNEGLTRKSKSAAYFEKPSEKRRREERERRKAIRLSMRSRKQDLQKLLNRRRKARKSARSSSRDDGEMLGDVSGLGEMGGSYRESESGFARAPSRLEQAPVPQD